MLKGPGLQAEAPGVRLFWKQEALASEHTWGGRLRLLSPDGV